MTEPTDDKKTEKKLPSLTDNLMETIEILKRSEMNVPKAIVIAAVIIALGIILS